MPIVNHSPSLADVDNVHSIRAGFPQIGLHVHLKILGPDMTLRCEQHLDVLRGGIENGRKVGRSHLEGFDLRRSVKPLAMGRL